jgi:hypothetical protein
VPAITIDLELLAPDTKVMPVVLPSVSVNVPLVGENESCSMLLPALLSLIVIASLLAGEKTTVPVRVLSTAGAVIAGGLLLTVKATLFEAERLSTVSVSEMASESEPKYPFVGFWVD